MRICSLRNENTLPLLNDINNFENVTHSAQGETVFFGGNFLFRISELTQRERVCSFRKLQIFISQTTDSHFANYRFSFRKLQILISQTTDFHFANYISISKTTDFHFANYRFPFRFVPFRFANYSKPSDFTYNEDLKSSQNAGNCICGVRKIQDPLLGMSLCNMLCVNSTHKSTQPPTYLHQAPTFKSNDNPEAVLSLSVFFNLQ